MSEMETQLEECGVCHALHPMEELTCFDDTLICSDCLEDSTVVCGRCGERMWTDDDVGNEDSGHLCQSCYDRYYNTCERCHRIICEEDAYYEDDDTVLCYDCHRRHRSRYSINDYSYKPAPIFYGSDTLYMGVEIELDEGGESDNQAKKLLEIANRDVRFSKIMGYETPCSVTGTGYMQAKRMHLKAYAQIGISERGKAAAHECIHTMERLL